MVKSPPRRATQTSSKATPRCRNRPCTESGEGGCPPIDVGNGVTTESAPNIWRWRTAVEHHAGIDVSLELSSVCVVDGRGKIVREAKVASEPGEAVTRPVAVIRRTTRI